MTRMHANCVDFDGVGVLIRGPSGVGKSDLALRVLGLGARLVADDQVFLMAGPGLGGGDEALLYAFAPQVLRGRIEVRGVGIIEVPCRSVSVVGCVIDLIADRDPERMPDPVTVDIAGVQVPCHRLNAFEAAAPQKVAAIARLCDNPLRRS